MTLSPVTSATTKSPDVLLEKAALRKTSPENEELHAETKKPAEVMLFAQRSEYAVQTPKFTATSKPTFEHTGAAAASVHTQPSLFTTNSEGRFVAATGFAHAGGVSTELASALSAPSKNSRGGDKHDDGSPQYVSAQKSLVDKRYEILEEPILSGIFSMC